jgi:hypothetical protein
MKSSEEMQQELRAEIVEKDKHHDILDVDPEANVMGTQYMRHQVTMDIEKRERDLDKLYTEIVTHWKSYKDWLKKVKEGDGIEKLKAKTKAKEAKKAAKDKEMLWKILWEEKTQLKDAIRRDEHIRILGGQNYEIDFTEIDTSAPKAAAEAVNEKLRQREMSVQQFSDSIDMMQTDEVELDFEDIDRDVAELQMQDVEFEVEPTEMPEPEVDSGEDWS